MAIAEYFTPRWLREAVVGRDPDEVAAVEAVPDDVLKAVLESAVEENKDVLYQALDTIEGAAVRELIDGGW